MDRREFFRRIALGAAVIAVPAIAVAEPSVAKKMETAFRNLVREAANSEDYVVAHPNVAADWYSLCDLNSGDWWPAPKPKRIPHWQSLNGRYG
jgi:hypothetical protein